MRLLEFVPCGRPAALPEDSPPSPRLTEEAPPPSPRLTEEAAAPPLSPTTCAYAEKPRRRPSHGSASPWRPSLVAISEDGTTVATAGVAAKGAGRGGGTRMSRAKSTGRVFARKERDDFRHYGVPTVMPSFSPAAFLF
ncbi:translation initiation factor IF-2 [Phoenix dactylifera]|uniref:Translation initiation factor IF-2 n=1 Tax=Phoenix dactylifera TaxID=42345 RepID=A0A8B7CEG6_PHODC|nr:translation initiation factor IF-2 [Phoenix dactylifera]